MIVNRLRYIVLFPPAIILSTGLYNHYTRFEAPNPYQDLLAELHESGALDRSQDIILSSVGERILPTLTSFDRITINSKYDAESLNIYSVSTLERWGEFRSPIAEKVRESVMNNMIAIPPNIIMIDRAFIRELFFHVWNDISMYVQVVPFSKTSEEIESVGFESIVQEAVRMGVIDEHLRLNNIEAARRNPGSLDEYIDPVLEIVNELANSEISEVQFNAPSILYMSFMPLIAHEVGHLLEDNPGMFLENAEQLGEVITSRLQRNRENRADAYAIKMLSEHIDSRIANERSRGPCVSTWSHTHPVWDNIDFRATHAGPVDMPKSASDRLDTQITPEPALEKRSRRQFVPEYKLRIIAQADACKYGELGALLRREKLYSNQLSDWRREYAQNGVAGLRKSAPGPAPSKTPDQRRIEQLEKENSRLNRKLDIANDCLDLQKKALAMLDRLRSGKDV